MLHGFRSRLDGIMLMEDSVRPEFCFIKGLRPMESDHGDFYVRQTCCMSCGVPQAIAPELVGWRDQNRELNCYWIKQPETADELDRAIEILDTQDVGCHRYSGTDPTILKRCPPEYCDHPRSEMALGSRYTFAPSEIPVRFSLSVSEARGGLLTRLWRRVVRSGTSK